MRFITLVKASEAVGAPPQSYIEAVDRRRREAMEAGIVVATGGLAPTAEGVRIRVSKGKLAMTDGPFTEGKEVIGGYAVLELPTRAEAIESARAFMQFHADHWPGWEGEMEVRQLFETPSPRAAQRAMG
jgi:hypothetical protein